MILASILDELGIQDLNTLDDCKKVRRRLVRHKKQLERDAYNKLLLEGDEPGCERIMERCQNVTDLIGYIEVHISCIENQGQFNSHRISDPAKRQFYFEQRKGGAS